jgi:hypothetical protein
MDIPDMKLRERDRLGAFPALLKHNQILKLLLLPQHPKHQEAP